MPQQVRLATPSPSGGEGRVRGKTQFTVLLFAERPLTNDSSTAKMRPQHWHPRTTPVTAEDLGHCPVLVLHYWAIWNLRDRTMDDLLLPFQNEYAGRICFRSCDTDRAENRPFIHGIANIPALGLFVGGTWLR